MTVVEPIRNRNDLAKVEKILANQSMRNLLFFIIGTNCGLRISDLRPKYQRRVRKNSYSNY